MISIGFCSGFVEFRVWRVLGLLGFVLKESAGFTGRMGLAGFRGCRVLAEFRDSAQRAPYPFNKECTSNHHMGGLTWGLPNDKGILQ